MASSKGGADIGSLQTVKQGLLSGIHQDLLFKILSLVNECASICVLLIFLH